MWLTGFFRSPSCACPRFTPRSTPPAAPFNPERSLPAPSRLTVEAAVEGRRNVTHGDLRTCERTSLFSAPAYAPGPRCAESSNAPRVPVRLARGVHAGEKLMPGTCGRTASKLVETGPGLAEAGQERAEAGPRPCAESSSRSSSGWGRLSASFGAAPNEVPGTRGRSHLSAALASRTVYVVAVSELSVVWRPGIL